MNERATRPGGFTRIQERNRQVILEAGLQCFSEGGFRGVSLDQIARGARMSKPNVLYYFPTKEAIYEALLARQLETWLDPLAALDPDGDPRAEILGYVQRKLQMARDFPRESRLFAGEIISGAPRVAELLATQLRALVDDKAAVIRGWIEAGRIAPVDPHHLIFSIWALTQHYADFDVQVRAVLGGSDPFPAAERFLEILFDRALAPVSAPG